METFEEIRKLYDIRNNSFGIPELEIIECENRLGLGLPTVLRHYYLQFGNHKAINQTQDHLLLPSEINIYKERFFEFYEENQGNWGALIALADSSLDDPPVFYSYDAEVKAVDLKEFLIGMAFLQSIFVFPFNAHSAGINSETEKVIKEHWTSVRKFNSPSFEVEFLQNSENEIICLRYYQFVEPELSIAARTETLYSEIVNKINIIWDFTSLDED